MFGINSKALTSKQLTEFSLVANNWWITDSCIAMSTVELRIIYGSLTPVLSSSVSKFHHIDIPQVLTSSTYLQCVPQVYTSSIYLKYIPQVCTPSVYTFEGIYLECMYLRYILEVHTGGISLRYTLEVCTLECVYLKPQTNRNDAAPGLIESVLISSLF